MFLRPGKVHVTCMGYLQLNTTVFEEDHFNKEKSNISFIPFTMEYLSPHKPFLPGLGVRYQSAAPCTKPKPRRMLWASSEWQGRATTV